MTLYETALHYVQAGLSVIPIRGDGSKRPPVEWKVYQSRLPEERELRDWFVVTQPRGLAIVHGRVSGHSEVLDFDSSAIWDAFLVMAQLESIEELVYRLVRVKTPGGGRHLYYRCPGAVEGNDKLARRREEVPENAVAEGTEKAVLDKRDGKWYRILTEIETRGEGGYTLAPGSHSLCHPSGLPYLLDWGSFTRLPEITPQERAVLIELCRSFNQYVEPPKPERVPQPALDASIGGPYGRLRPGDDYNQRGDVRALLEKHGWRLDGRMGEVEKWARPGKERGHSATLGYHDRFFHVFSSNALPFESNRAYDPFGVYTVLEHSGDVAEAARVLAREGYGDRDIDFVHIAPPEPEKSGGNGGGGGGGTPGNRGVPPAAPPPFQPPFPRRRYNLTDLGNAERFVDVCGADVRHVHEWKRWYVWDGKRWAFDATGAVVQKAKTTVRGIYGELGGIEDRQDREETLKHAKRSEGAGRIMAMLEMARSEPPIPVTPDELDTEPLIINCLNGVLDLKACQLLPHQREKNLTRLAPVEYWPDAVCPKWMEFLSLVLPDAAVRDYVRRAVGYSLTGDIGERVMFLLYGSGRNGKSTFLDTIRLMLGEYAMRTPTEMLLAKRENGPTNHIARLKGARFVFASEAEEGRRLDEAIVKEMTGGERIVARFLNAEFFEFTPEFKLWMGTNHKPVVRGMDAAMWDRLPLIPFTVRIPEEQVRARREVMRELSAELSGVFTWAVEGCQEWLKGGLAPPPAVRAATQGYREEMDVVGQFLEERCLLLSEAKASAADLYGAYRSWCEASGEHVRSQRFFGLALSERGLLKEKAGTIFWKGVGLKALEYTPSPPNISQNGASSHQFGSQSLDFGP